MIERKLWRCEVCGTDYNSEIECEKCETTHKNIKEAEIVSAKFRPASMNCGTYPTEVTIKFPGDTIGVIYKRG